MDSQQCDIRLTSYVYTTDMMIIKWFDKKPIMVNPEIRFPEMSLTGVEAGYCDYINHEYGQTELHTLQGKAGNPLPKSRCPLLL